MAKWQRRSRPPTREEIDPDWEGLPNHDMGAIFIGVLEDNGVRRDHWAALDPEDRRAVIDGLHVAFGMADAFSFLLTAEKLPEKRSARRFMRDLRAKDSKHRTSVRGFHADTRRQSLLERAKSVLPRVETLLREIKASAKFADDAYSRSWAKVKLQRVRVEWGEAEEAATLIPTLEDILRLEKSTPREVASMTVGRALGIGAEAIRLGKRRSR